MTQKPIIIVLLIIFFSCEKEAVDCLTLENQLSHHPHIADLDNLISSSLVADNFIENCNSYYDEMESILDKGCINGWNTDTVSIYRNSICVEPLTGLWQISASKTFDNPDCNGPYKNIIDTLAWQYGSRLRLFIEFTLDQTIQTLLGSYSGPELCSMGLGTITGDTCNTFIGGISIDSLCTMNGGLYSPVSDSCYYDIFISTMTYSINDDNITLISFADTDSAYAYTGSWNINNGTLLNLSVSSSNSCIEIIASR